MRVPTLRVPERNGLRQTASRPTRPDAPMEFAWRA
jgi:hypothetical protein